jgi:hypothetical protein
MDFSWLNLANAEGFIFVLIHYTKQQVCVQCARSGQTKITSLENNKCFEAKEIRRARLRDVI